MKNSKRVLSVSIKRMVDDSPDTSWLGEYSNHATSEFSIDRAHADNCASIIPVNPEGIRILISARAFVAETQSRLPDAESQDWQDLEEAYYLLDGLTETPKCDCDGRGDMERHECRYFNPGSVEKFNPDAEWFAKYPAEQRKAEWETAMRSNAHRDYKRMESLNNGDWCFIGIRAEAEIGIGGHVTHAD